MSPEDFIATQATHEYPLPPHQLAALDLFLTDPTVPVSEIARKLVAPKTTAVGDYDSSVLWGAIADGIRYLTDFNDRFVDLVIAIHQLPGADGQWSSMIEYQMYWTEFAYDCDLPPENSALSQQQANPPSPVKVPRSTDPERESKRQAWINLNAFCAKISLRNIPILNERPRASFVLKVALERAPWEATSHPDIEEMLREDPDDEVVAAQAAYEVECRDVRVLEYWAPAAAVWMKVDAEGIYGMEGKMSEADEQSWYPSKWKGEKGWNRGRFRFWMERFEWIGTVVELSEETRRDAVEAAGCMANVLDEDGS